MQLRRKVLIFLENSCRMIVMQNADIILTSNIEILSGTVICKDSMLTKAAAVPKLPRSLGTLAGL